MAQGLILNGSNSSYNYRYRSMFGNTDVSTGFRMTYNGVPVVYVPKEWAEKGAFVNDTQYFSPNYLNKDVWQYMKPAQLEPGKWNETLSPKLSGFVSNPNDGYIIDEAKFKQFQLSGGQQQPRWTASGKPNPPISGIGENNGQLVYVGKSGDNRNGELAMYNASGQGTLHVNTSQSSFWGDVGRTLGSLGPATLLLNAVVPGLGTAVYAGTNIGQAIESGNWGKAALNIALTSVPGPGGTSAAQGTLFEIPAIANSVKTISSTLGVSAGVAGAIVNTAVNLLANGGNLTDALKTTLAQQLGQDAANYASQLANLQGMKGLDTVLKSVTQESTKALLLNQDVTKAAQGAFVNSAVPMALQSTPGWDKLSATQQKAVTSAALSAARDGQIGSAIKSYTAQVFADSAVDQIGGSLTDSQKQLARQTIVAGIEGKPLDSALQSFMIGEARNAISNQVAQAEGWQDNAQKQAAIKQYGNKVKPDEYIAKQQGWEDLAAKQAAIKSYGDTITPLGFKEREQVKAIDPKFDAEAYAKLNEVTGDPFQHFLEQGKNSNLPTNYEKGAEAALASIGYKADANEIKTVADLFKSSANPDVALNKYYDEHWVTPGEAAATARQAGFELTPEQLARFTGQARAGQGAVFEDIEFAANIGKTSQQQRETFVNNYLADITKAYEDQGYTKAQIAAAMPEIRNNLGASADAYVNQLKNYAEQTRWMYGTQSPEFAEAQRKLLDAQASMGGYGLIREANGYKSATGEFIPSETPQQPTVWIQDRTKAPAAPVEGGDRLILSGGFEGPSKASETIRKEYAAIGIPGKTQVLSSEGAEKSALVGEIPSGMGDGKVPTLFGIPLSASFADIGSDSWVRVDQDTWVTPDNKYTFLALPGGGEVRDVQTKNIVAKLTPQETAQITPAKPPTPVVPQEQVPQTVQEIIKAADEKRISPQEAQKALEEAIGKAGYKATPEEIQQQIAALQGEKTPEQLQKEIGEYIDPRMVTAEEVKQMYRDLGLMEPTEADISRFAGQRSQAELPEILKPYLPTASANVITQQAQQDAARRASIDAQIGGLDSRITDLQRQGMSQMDATNKALGELASGQAGLGQQITGLQAGFGKALEGLAAGFGKTAAGLQQQLGQAQEQAAMGNLITILGLGKKQEQPAAPIPLVGKITPYQFSSNLLEGIYQPPQANIYGANQQLLNLTKG